MKKNAETSYEIHELLKSRWSPRAFSNRTVEPGKLLSLFEAARWSPSGGNKQPWAFVVVMQDDEEGHRRFVDVLSGRNQLWAKNAPVLILAIAKPDPQSGALGKYAYYDVGQAVAHLSVQAAALDLYTHQMAGFDGQRAKELFGLPEGCEPMTVIALGYYGNADELPAELRERELAARTRIPIPDFVHAGRWGRPFTAPG
jgi:nitroreductase